MYYYWIWEVSSSTLNKQTGKIPTTLPLMVFHFVTILLCVCVCICNHRTIHLASGIRSKGPVKCVASPTTRSLDHVFTANTLTKASNCQLATEEGNKHSHTSIHHIVWNRLSRLPSRLKTISEPGQDPDINLSQDLETLLDLKQHLKRIPRTYSLHQI